MLQKDLYKIGNSLQKIRKKTGLTQEEVAEGAGISSRTYADIERGSVNPRIETLLMICETLHITPDDVLTSGKTRHDSSMEEVWKRLVELPTKEQKMVILLLDTYIDYFYDS